MTFVSMWKICPGCHRRYDWNPDAGRFNCPYCRGFEATIGKIADTIFGKAEAKESGDEKSDSEN